MYLLLKDYDPTKRPATCELSQWDSSSWKKGSKKPVYVRLRLADDMEIACPRSKKRPVVLLNPTAKPEGFRGSRNLDKTLMSMNRWLTLPLWSYKDDVPGHEELKVYVDCLTFPAFFPFPTSPVKADDKYPNTDSFGRLDYIQPIHVSMLEPTKNKVSLDIYDYLTRHISAFINKLLALTSSPSDYYLLRDSLNLDLKTLFHLEGD